MSEQRKIIQILMTHDNSQWQGVLLGLDNKGVTHYINKRGVWEDYVPPLGYKLEDKR